MSLIRYLRDQSPGAFRFVLIMSMISGLAGGVLVALVNTAASVGGSDRPLPEGSIRLVLLFVIALAILLTTKRYLLLRSTETVEQILRDLQVKLADKIRRSELETMERLDTSTVLTAVTQNIRTISTTVFALSNAAQECFTLVFAIFYLAMVSVPALVLYLIVAALGAVYYYRQDAEARDALGKYAAKGSELFKMLTLLVYGFKELRLNRRKNDDLFRDIRQVADDSQAYATQADHALTRANLAGDLAFYLLAGSVVFLLPQFYPTTSAVLVQATIAVMYTIGPLGALVGAAPQLANADVALDTLKRLEADLDGKMPVGDGPGTKGDLAGAKAISLKGVGYSYRTRDGSSTFSVGPIDLDIKREEILFIVGGNGSGKSTLIKLIAGLYLPQSGRIEVDGGAVTAANIAAYRGLFAGVFADFTLFPRLYGVGEIDYQRVEGLLKRLEIDHKVRVVDGRFTTLDLSTGQKKRLALLASLLEDREIYLFDEWTADQDPQFRERFYYSILPELRANGKTIIAVTHDDRYWGVADRVVKLDYGKIVPPETGAPPGGDPGRSASPPPVD